MNGRLLEGFRGEGLAEGLLRGIGAAAKKTGPVELMEVCGTHTVAIFRSGLRNIIEPGIKLLSGPGCPVCVTPAEIIDAALLYARRKGWIVTTFGDMVRVPGSRGTLEAARAEGSDVRIVYSPLDALKIAVENPEKKVVFNGVGFETTAPAVAATIAAAKNRGVDNFGVLCAHKLVPPALEALCETGDSGIRGFICPGHVSAIIGSNAYRPVAARYGMPCVVTGFEPLDILQGILMLLEQVADGRAEVENQYSRVVKPEGNRLAMEKMLEVFEPVESRWRGLGEIRGGGLRIRGEYSGYDAMVKWPVELTAVGEPPGCRCGEVLSGKVIPPECGLFGKACSPESPVGPCMVSSEGTCAAFFKYGGG